MGNKIILVFYVNTKRMSLDETQAYLKEVADTVTFEEQDTLNYFIIPIKDGESRVECLNPKLVSKEDYKEAKKVLDRAQKAFNKAMKEWEKN